MEKDTSEIAKLAERIAKDPKSKLFVPLAEEHKKAGDIAMAIQVLTEGLKNNPSYVTARSFLGRLLMEQGDLAGAQKELEEVIKSIPDNLLAQRKLGDIYVLQGRAKDAVQRYKAALMLNPADKELPPLIADIEAGKDVASRIPGPKAPAAAAAQKPAPAQAAPVQPKAPAAAPGKPSAAAAPAAAKPAAPVQQPVRPAASTPVQTPPAAPAAPPPPKQQPATAKSAPVHDEAEVVEEIVHIESIEQPAAKAMEAAPVVPPAPSAAAPAAAASSAQPDALSFDLTEAAEAAPAATEEPGLPVWTVEAAVAAAESVPVAPAPEEGGDDLNTNTLAELYISQGFYDKALEVYEGMLGDRPGNKALLQKIEQLKAMAGEQVSSTPLATAAREYTAPPAAAPEPAAATAPAGAPAETQRPVPEKTAAAARAEAPAPAPPAPAEPAAIVHRGAKTASMRRKETIDRLESWLKNVKKEKV